MKNSVKKEIKKTIKELNLNCSIEEFKDKVDWYEISINQKLSENFIREFQDKVNWEYISSDQILSLEFVREFQDKVEWECIEEYQNITREDIKEYEIKEKLNKTRVKNKFQLIRF
ncbi:MAG TPA: hypothetical protein VMZ91_04405 [Candidatus Paceibacterota bacterium]|nr:hypothetical protein [Candidatus Paceibacterota bacterium]